ncbi:hypothetical protein [Dyadobacter luticola]|uniref:SGNH/GDSL hydrolase family protein n=1 Tax=Dyadobacter luticola TaxID=1979387 RepID=A0A5R9KW66_9BACT|nr:hypothetical protein [Dyadobacter luticola]TLV00390.1 hypothetical protein FEN17_12930 [Dyadobacter luticola]
MTTRNIIFLAVFCFLLLLVLELSCRAIFVFYGYPFFKPADYVYKGFYPIIGELGAENVRADDDVEDILILGGSVVSTPWSRLEMRLDTILRRKYHYKKKFAFYNAAVAGHTSLDNLIKYKLFNDNRFDLVIYYEAINENRANCIPPEDFRLDYSHIKWYKDIHRLQNHPEINYAIIPYACDILISTLADLVLRRKYASREEVAPGMVKYGRSIKTAGAYQRNLNGIISLAKERGDRLLLLKYASYFPKGAKLTGEDSDKARYAGCNYACSVSIWGDADNVKKGIFVHNQILTNLALKNRTYYFDMAGNLPQQPQFFCDVCHVSELGAQTFANKLAEYIVKEKILERPNSHKVP